MRSILQSEKRVCFLCRVLHGDDHEQPTHCHHVMYGIADRKLSEQYGLKVYLCPKHHEFSEEAVHRNKDINLMLRKAAQVVFITKNGNEKWKRLFNRNFLDDEELAIRADNAFEAVGALTKPKEAGAFEITDDPIGADMPF